jgi:methylmalonyl-CoA/ethylmalonyl-CoA epimerase
MRAAQPGALVALRGIHHASISVPDLEVALEWYARVLGFALEHRFELAAIQARAAFVRHESVRIEIWEVAGGVSVPTERREPHSDLHQGGTKHVALLVDDLQSCLERLHAEHVDIAAVQRAVTAPMQPESDPRIRFSEGAFAAFIRDPAGILIELIDAARAGPAAAK